MGLIEVKNKVLQRGIHYLTSGYGERVLNGKKEFHAGVDLVSYYNGQTTIDYCVSYADGVVTYNGYNGDRGYCVTINHGDFETIYQHLRYISILNVGMKVKAGWAVGLMGSTGYSVGGSHLHFGVYKDGEWVDPMPYLMEEDKSSWDWAVENGIVLPTTDRKAHPTNEEVVSMLYMLP